MGKIETTAFGDGGIDTVTTLGGNDVVLGGHLGDVINAGEGDNVVLGDDGEVDFVRAERGVATPGADIDASDIDIILSLSTTLAGGADTITTGNGNDIVIGGRDGDTINAGNGNNIVVGDSVEIIAANSDASRFGTQTITVGWIETITTNDGGADSITTGLGYDLIFGGMANDTIVANFGETAGTPDAGNVVLGDNGYIDFVRAERQATELGGDLNPADIDVIASTAPADGGVDDITTGLGLDIVTGGQAGDILKVGDGNNVIIGDSGMITAATGDLHRFGTQPLSMGRIETTAYGIGGADTITSGSGNDLILGGHDADTINAGEGDNLVAGDDAAIDFTLQEREGVTPGADLDASDIDLIVSTSTALNGGVDTITTGNGNDIVIGGRFGDTINAAGGRNIVIGDSGVITAANEDVNRFGAQSMTVGRIEAIAFGDGGVDQITTLGGNDVVLGGHDDDTINAGEGDNIVLGDDGAIEYVRFERGGATPGADTDASDIDLITSLSTTAAGGIDQITTGSGNDIVMGGRFGDTINAGQGNNVVIGDSGIITAANENPNRFVGQPITAITVGRIETIEFGDGGVDAITTGSGNDVVLGGHEGDTINAGEGDNVVLGDDGAIEYVRFERGGATPGADTDASDIDLITSLSTTAAGGIDQITTGSGSDIVIGGRFGDTINAGDGANIVVGDSGRITAADGNTFRFGSAPLALVTVARIETITPGDGNNDRITTGAGKDLILGGFADDIIGSGGGDDRVFGDNGYFDFLVNDGNPQSLDVMRTTDPLLGGNDLITAGAGDDIVFGGTGNDGIWGESGCDIILGDHGLVDYTRPANQVFLSIFTTATDAAGDDTIYGGAEDDFILGQQGNDTIYGGTGQDDITGGHNVVGGADGNDTIYGGDKPGNPTSDLSKEAFVTAGDGADVILGDNGILTRQVLGLDLWKTYPAPFADVIRFITLLDNVDLVLGNDSIYGDAGQDIIHGQRGDDVINGGSEDDEINGELGNDILAGGTGNDIIVGDAGQIIRALNADGTPRINVNGSWHRDVLFEDIGVITGVIDLDVTPLRSFDPALVAKILESDLLLLGGVYLPGGAPLINSDTGAWATKLYLIDIVDANNDVLRGGDGEDLLFGQRGDDTLEGGGGNDSLFGDGFTNTVPFETNLPQAISGVRLISFGPGVNLPILLPFGGALVIPNIALRPEEFTSFVPDISFVPNVAPAFAQAATNDALIGTNGSAFVPFASVVPDIVHHIGMLPGSDRLDGGAGDDLLVGDDATASAPLFTGVENLEEATAEARAEIYWLLRGLHYLGLDQQQLAKQRGQPTGVKDIVLGNDVLAGGDGDDTVVGDNALFVTPFMVGLPVAEIDFQKGALEYQRFLFDLRHAVLDLSFVVSEAHIQVLQGLVSDLPTTNPRSVKVTKSNAIDPDIHNLSIGNDTINGGAGGDMLFGDDASFFAPVLDAQHYNVYGSISTGTLKAVDAALASVVKAERTAISAHVAANHSNPSARLPTRQERDLIPWDWEYSLSTSNDTILGGTGDDLIVGDFAGIVTPVVLSLPQLPKNDDWRNWDSGFDDIFKKHYYSGHGFGFEHYNHGEDGIDGPGLLYWPDDHDHDIFHRGSKDAVRNIGAGNDTLRGEEGNDYVMADNLYLVVGFVGTTPPGLFKPVPYDFDHNDYDFDDRGRNFGYDYFFSKSHHWRNYGLFYGDHWDDDRWDDDKWAHDGITGQQSRDNVDGGLGNDILVGGKDHDVLTGGGGTDSIVKDNDSRPKDSVLDQIRDRFFQLVSPQYERFLLDLAGTKGLLRTSGDVFAVNINGTTGTVFGLPANSAVVAGIQGAASAVRGEPLTFQGLLGGQPAPTGGNSTWQVRDSHGVVVASGAVAQWKVIDSTGTIVAVGAGASLDFQPSASGTYAIYFGVADGNGGAGVKTASLVVLDYQVRPDAATPGGQVLVVGGTAGRDYTDLKVGRVTGSIALAIEFKDSQAAKLSVEFLAVNRVVVYGGLGSDQITVDSRVAIPVELHGGAGNDQLNGGGGNDILFGEAGNDTLVGNNGNDVLVGGNGHDQMSGSSGNDLLIGGLGVDDLDGDDGSDILIGSYTALDTDPAGLAAVRTAWLGSATFATRTTELRANLLSPAKVFNDTSRDALEGGKDADWFLADRSGTGGDDDTISDQKSEDKLDSL